MFKLFDKTVSVLYVELGGKEIEAGRIKRVLEDFSEDDEINDYDLDKIAADILVVEGVLKIEDGSRQAILYCRADKFDRFYEEFTEQYYDEVESRKKCTKNIVSDAVNRYGCTLSVFSYRYGGETIILLGSESHVRDIEDILDGGDMESADCFDILKKQENIPIYIGNNVADGIAKIEAIIESNTKNRTLKEYLESVSEKYYSILED